MPAGSRGFQASVWPANSARRGATLALNGQPPRAWQTSLRDGPHLRVIPGLESPGYRRSIAPRRSERTVIPIRFSQRRRLRFLLLLRARLPVFLRDLPGLFLALPHERSFHFLFEVKSFWRKNISLAFPYPLTALPGKFELINRIFDKCDF